MDRPCFLATHRGDEGGSAYYRVLLPVLLARHLGMIQTRIPDKMLFFPKEILEIMRPDAVFFHRAHTAPQIKYMMDLARSLDTLKIYTIDDWVGKVPKESPHYKDIPKGIDKDIKKAIDLCDRLIVTTDLLQSVYGYKQETYVIPNYLSELMWQPIYNLPITKPDFDSVPRIGWSGGMGHPGDLKILHEIAEILGDKVRWVFLGDMPQGFDQGNSEIHQPVPVQQYSFALHSLHLDLALAPLLDNEFNRAKSNLRVLEYAACGYPVIASNIKTYQGTAATLLEYNAKWWAETILKKLEDREALYAEGQKMKDWVWENYKLEDHIKEYANIFSPDREAFIPSKPEVSDVVDVLITTHNNLEIVHQCVESVIRSLPDNRSKIEIVVSDNASTETGFQDYLQELKNMGITVINREKDDGYIININGACAINPTHDIITLNSDTIVNGNWIDRLRSTAYMEESIASVTPFTNNGTIMSYPNPQGTNLEPALVRFYDEVASQLEPSSVLQLPTNVGFCTYIKRKVLAEIGVFDSKAFGRGYGEENDWSMRAHDRGWKHIADPTVYVGHQHGATFGPEKQKLLETSARVLTSRWQNYPQLIKQWVEADLLKTTRERLDLESIAKLSTEPRILYIAHGYGGGLETYLQSQLKLHPNAIILRNNPQQQGLLILEVPGEQYFNLPVINSKLSSIIFLRDTFQRFNIQHISVQTTFGYDVNFPIWIENLAHVMDIEYSVMLHDYLTVCPRLRLVQNVNYCGEPSVHECDKCVMNYGSAFGQVDVADYRKMYHRLLKKASKVQAPSKDLSQRLLGYFPDVSIEVVPHEPNLEIRTYNASLPYVEGTTLKIACIGSISPDKGSLVIRDCAKYCEDNKLPIQFLVFGNLIDNRIGIQLIEQTDYLRIFNSYQELELRAMLELNKCHLYFMSSLWPESHSYVLSHAFRAGLWPVCFDIGAPVERIREKGFGTVLPYEKYTDISYLVNSFQRIAKENVNDA